MTLSVEEKEDVVGRFSSLVGGFVTQLDKNIDNLPTTKKIEEEEKEGVRRNLMDARRCALAFMALFKEVEGEIYLQYIMNIFKEVHLGPRGIEAANSRFDVQWAIKESGLPAALANILGKAIKDDCQCPECKARRAAEEAGGDNPEA